MPTQRNNFRMPSKAAKIDSVKESHGKEYEEEDLEGDETGLEVGPEIAMMKNLV
jgi:hypothetical protein